jgi:hypothetical protein
MLNHPGVTGRKPGQASSHLVDDPVRSEPETAKYLGVSTITLRRWRKAGKIGYIQLSDNRVGYRLRAHADKYLDEHSVEPTARSAEQRTAA